MDIWDQNHQPFEYPKMQRVQPRPRTSELKKTTFEHLKSLGASVEELLLLSYSVVGKYFTQNDTKRYKFSSGNYLPLALNLTSEYYTYSSLTGSYGRPAQ